MTPQVGKARLRCPNEPLATAALVLQTDSLIASVVLRSNYTRTQNRHIRNAAS